MPLHGALAAKKSKLGLEAMLSLSNVQACDLHILRLARTDAATCTSYSGQIHAKSFNSKMDAIGGRL